MGGSTMKKMGIHHENWGIKNEDLTTQDLSKHVETAGLVMFESAV